MLFDSIKLFDKIDQFEELQERYAHLGAFDTEISQRFHNIVREALDLSCNFNDDEDGWELYWNKADHIEELNKANYELTQAAKVVFDEIRNTPLKDIPYTKLKRHCWRTVL